MIKKRGGFTFTEIVITIAIIAIITVLSLSRYNNFTSSAIITNTAIEFIEIVKTVKEYSASSYIPDLNSDSFGLYILDIPINKNEYKLYFTNNIHVLNKVNDPDLRDDVKEIFGMLDLDEDDLTMVRIGGTDVIDLSKDQTSFSLITNQINLTTIRVFGDQVSPNVERVLNKTSDSVRILYKQPDFVPYMIITRKVNDNGIATIFDENNASVVEFTFSANEELDRSAHFIVKSGAVFLK